jgi:hypothetical protein
VVFAMDTKIRGGSMDTDVNELTVVPLGPASSS